MNRQQAEYILDAYVRLRMCESYEDASNALHEVILEAMTGYRSSTITAADITYPQITPRTQITPCKVGERRDA